MQNRSRGRRRKCYNCNPVHPIFRNVPNTPKHCRVNSLKPPIGRVSSNNHPKRNTVLGLTRNLIYTPVQNDIDSSLPHWQQDQILLDMLISGDRRWIQAESESMQFDSDSDYASDSSLSHIAEDEQNSGDVLTLSPLQQYWLRLAISTARREQAESELMQFDSDWDSASTDPGLPGSSQGAQWAEQNSGSVLTLSIWQQERIRLAISAAHREQNASGTMQLDRLSLREIMLLFEAALRMYPLI
jgi:hypothetical protein